MAFFVDFLSLWTDICTNCSNLFPFWRHQIFSIVSLRGLLVCSLIMLVHFSRWILWYRLISYSNAMQRWFVSFCVCQSSSPESCDEVSLWLLLKNQLVRFQSFVLTVFWDFNSYTVIFLFWMMLVEPVDKRACWWPWSCLIFVYGLRRLEKTWSFWDAYKSLTWCSKIVPT